MDTKAILYRRERGEIGTFQVLDTNASRLPRREVFVVIEINTIAHLRNERVLRKGGKSQEIQHQFQELQSF